MFLDLQERLQAARGEAGDVLVILSDVIFQWRGQNFAVGGTTDPIAKNVDYVAGSLLAALAVGLVMGLISHHGLKRVISDDAAVPVAR